MLLVSGPAGEACLYPICCSPDEARQLTPCVPIGKRLYGCLPWCVHHQVLGGDWCFIVCAPAIVHGRVVPWGKGQQSLCPMVPGPNLVQGVRSGVRLGPCCILWVLSWCCFPHLLLRAGRRGCVPMPLCKQAVIHGGKPPLAALLCMGLLLWLVGMPL